MSGGPVGNGFWPERLSYLAAMTEADAIAVVLFGDAGSPTLFGAHNISARRWRPDAGAIAELQRTRVPVEAGISIMLADGRRAGAVCLAPIVVDDRMTGFMVGARVGRPWAPMDRLLLLKAAGLSSLEVNEALAARSVQAAIEQLARNARIDRELYRDMHALDDVESFLDTAPQRLAQRFGADRVSLMLVGGDDSLVVRSAFGLRDDFARRAKRRVGEGIAGWVAQHGEPLLLRGAVEEARFKGVDPTIASAIIAPLRARDRIIGVVNVKSRDDAAAYDTAALNELAAIAADLGIALVRGGVAPGTAFEVRGVVETERVHVRILFELSRLAMFGHPRRNLDAVAALLNDSLGDEVVGIWLLQGTGRLRLVTSRGYDSLRPAEIDLATDRHLRTVTSEARALAVDLPEPLPWSVTGVARYALAPVLVEGVVKGVLALGRKTSQYTARETEFAGILGAYVGLIVAAYERQHAAYSPLLPMRERLTTELTDVVLTLEVLQRLLRSDPALPERLARAARDAQHYLSELNTFTSSDRPEHKVDPAPDG